MYLSLIEGFTTEVAACGCCCLSTVATATRRVNGFGLCLHFKNEVKRGRRGKCVGADIEPALCQSLAWKWSELRAPPKCTETMPLTSVVVPSIRFNFVHFSYSTMHASCCVAAATCGTQTIVWHLSQRAWAELKKREWIQEWECYMNWGGMPDQAKPRRRPSASTSPNRSPAQQCKSRISLAVAGNRPERSLSWYLGIEAFLIFNQL